MTKWKIIVWVVLYMKQLLQRSNIYDHDCEKILIELLALVLQLSASRVGTAASLGELLVTQHLTACNAREEPVTVSATARALEIPKATVSRLLTEMRAKGLTIEEPDPTDGRSHTVKLSDAHFERIRREMQVIIDWCQLSEHAFI